MSKKKKRQFTRGDRNEIIIQALVGAPDRVCPLIGSEFVSDALKGYLRTKFTKNELGSNLCSKLLDDYMAPLSSFAMSAVMCRAFGLIGPNTFEMVEHLRNIRNHCAHGTQVTLQDTEIKEHVRGLAGYAESTLEKPYLRMWKSSGEDLAAASYERRAVLHGSFMLEGWIVSRQMYLYTDQDYDADFLLTPNLKR